MTGSLCAPRYMDSVSFEDFIKEAGLEYGIVLTDKGFPPSKVAGYYKDKVDLHYLSPLKRSDKRIDEYSLHDYDSMPLSTKNRDVLARKVAVSGRDGRISYYLYYFYFRERALKEEADWFRHNRGKTFSRQELEEKKAEFGTIAFESDVDRESGEIYKLYDERCFVEEFFRYYKDEDEFDDTKVQLTHRP